MLGRGCGWSKEVSMYPEDVSEARAAQLKVPLMYAAFVRSE